MTKFKKPSLRSAVQKVITIAFKSAELLIRLLFLYPALGQDFERMNFCSNSFDTKLILLNGDIPVAYSDSEV